MEDRPKRSLADDPTFLVSLNELDRGLPGPDDDDFSAPAASAPRPSRPAPPPVLPPPAAPPASHGTRPLLELFPTLDQPPARLEPPPVVPPRHAIEPLALDTADYATFYGLYERPFGLAAADLKFLYHSAEHDRAAQAMLGAIWRRDGIVVLTGRTGVGKTMLCRAVIEQLDRRTLTSFISEPFESGEALLKNVLLDFGVISRADLTAGRMTHATRAELSAALRNFLSSLAPLQAFAVVIIDDAENLPVEILRQVGILVESEGDERLLQVVLAGQPGLMRTLSRSELKPLARRVSVRCPLGPLAADEIAGYVAHRLTAAGASARVEFEDAAIRRLHDLSGGVPRTVNLLCDRALSAGYVASASLIDTRLIESAADDLDLAPPLTRAAVARLLAATALLFLLVLAGAYAAVYVLRAEVAAAAQVWEQVPPPPAPPARNLPSLPPIVP